MAFEGMLSKMGSDMKHLTDRYAEYGAPMQDPHLLYTYEPAGPTHEAASKHQYGGGNKNNAAMSALTLLAFLFFLHILQQCIKDHMVAMSTPQITIMTAGREGDDALKKHAKIDKAGFTVDVDSKTKETAANKGVVNKFDADDVMKSDEHKYLMKINTADPPNGGGGGAQTYDYGKVYDERRSAPAGFVSAMADDQQ